MRLLGLVSAGMMAAFSLGLAGSVWAESPSEVLARRAVSETPSESQEAIATLRAQGPKGLAAFLDTYGNQLTATANPQLKAVLDRLCQQRDCYASRLYWYTDLAQAKAAAKASGKPILSLRLLGRLDEELSCANSRFFRVVLYPNAEVSKVLRDRFILHWQSVRPVPKVTIDFGDGRQLERTITGNSIHYVLDTEGRIVDALPGLYGPQAFLSQLAEAENLVQELNALTDSQKDSVLRQYYRDRLAAIQANWTEDLSELDIAPPSGLTEIPTDVPTAEEAGQRAMSKMYVEMPLLTSITGNQEALTAATDEEAWANIAKLHAEEARLDSNSQTLMRNKNPDTYDISGRGITPGSADDPLMPIVTKFESLIALDTVRNQYLLQPKIYTWLLESPVQNVDSLNEIVYDQLFLTPSSDPWLGLFPSDGYTAIENEGVRR
ncbi:MAG TPA: hypothetical protein DC064_25040 [Cyanobacteria bacterium UBA9273]|nr:hypothetical protein [Cyanobacteria bacterium UBA9273]